MRCMPWQFHLISHTGTQPWLTVYDAFAHCFQQRACSVHCRLGAAALGEWEGGGGRQGSATQGRMHCLTWPGNNLRCSWDSINSHCQGQQAITSNVSLPCPQPDHYPPIHLLSPVTIPHHKGQAACLRPGHASRHRCINHHGVPLPVVRFCRVRVQPGLLGCCCHLSGKCADASSGSGGPAHHVSCPPLRFRNCSCVYRSSSIPLSQ